MHSTAFGTHDTPEYSADRLISLYFEPPFIVAAIIAVGFFILFSVIYFVRIESLVQYRIVAIAIMPSILGAATLVSLKAIGEFVKNLSLGHNSFNTVGYAI